MAKAIILIGIQGSGKSTFYRERLSEYVHVNLDTLHTRNKERLLIEECLENGQTFVVDNTNPTKADREKYIDISKLSKTANFYKYQNKVNAKPKEEAGHVVIEQHIDRFGEDYRVQDKEHPVKALRSRTEDNFTIGRQA